MDYMMTFLACIMDFDVEQSSVCLGNYIYVCHCRKYHMNNLRIVTLNVRGLRGNTRYSIYNWFKDNKFDICLVQESYCTKEFASEIKKGWNGELIHS